MHTDFAPLYAVLIFVLGEIFCSVYMVHLLCSAVYFGIESLARTFVASLFARLTRPKIVVMQPAAEEAKSGGLSC